MHGAAARLHANARHRAVPSRSRLRRAFFGSRSAARPPLALVLDVDETLWRTYIPGISKTKKLANYDFTVKLAYRAKDTKDTDSVAAWSPGSRQDVGEVEDESPTVLKKSTITEMDIHVSLRPGLHEFFEWMRARRHEGLIEGPWIFTQASSSYLHALLRELDPTREMFGERLLTRHECTRMRMPWPWVHKELDRIPCGNDQGVHPERVVLVENNVMSCLLYPKNSLIVHDWTGVEKGDSELRRVSTTLDALLSETSVDTGDYADTLAAMTPGHNRYEKALSGLQKAINDAPAETTTPAVAIKGVWQRALRVKAHLLKHVPPASQNRSISSNR